MKKKEVTCGCGKRTTEIDGQKLMKTVSGILVLSVTEVLLEE